jgi:heme/copper-type cytochrome/quinol oxidase subunit 1
MKNLLLTHRRLGLFYIVFGAIAACVGLLIAVLLRMELHAPGIQFINNRQFNILAMGHGLILPLSGTIPLLFCGFGHMLVHDKRNSKPQHPRVASTAIAGLVTGFVLAIIAALLSLVLASDPSISTGWEPLKPQNAWPRNLLIASVLCSYFGLSLTAITFVTTIIRRKLLSCVPLMLTAMFLVLFLLWDAVRLFAAATGTTMPLIFGELWTLSDAVMIPSVITALGIVVTCCVARFNELTKVTPVLYLVGYLASCSIAVFGVLLLANAGVDRSLDNTYFVVANEHVASAVAVTFAIVFGGYVLFRDINNQTYSQAWGILQFVLVTLALIIAFAPQYPLGLAGMPRKYADYPDAFTALNRLSSLGTYVAFGAVSAAAIPFLLRAWIAATAPE